MPKLKYKLIIVAIAALVAELVYPAFNGVAEAAPQFTRAIVRWDNHNDQEASGVTVCVVPPTGGITVPAGTDTSPYHVRLVFPYLTAGTSFTFTSTTASDWDIDTSFAGEGNINGLAMTAWTGIGAEADAVTAPVGNTSAGYIDIPFGTAGGFTLADTSMYCFHVTGTGTLVNSVAATAPTMIEGSVQVYDNAGSPVLLYETLYSTAIINDDTITLTAIVPPNFTFTLTGNTDTFASRLSTTAINVSNGVSFTIVTNAKGGWVAWIKDFTRAGAEGLFSTTANYLIPTGPVGGAGATVGDGDVEVLPTGGLAEGYLMDANVTNDAANGCTFPNNTAGGGTNPGSNIEYDSDDGVSGTDTRAGGTLSQTFQPVAECNGTPPATANGDTVQLRAKVTIAGSTPAGTDYTDIITVVAAGQF